MDPGAHVNERVSARHAGAHRTARVCTPLAPLAGVLILLASAALAQDAADHDTCLECHSDESLEGTRDGQAISCYVDATTFRASVHGSVSCSSCHADTDPEDLPHADDLAAVACGRCHAETQTDFDISIHGTMHAQGAPLAPTCLECHGKHEILSTSDPDSPTYKINVPSLCGGCHREGAPVARAYDIPQKDILENYSESIHGQGLFQKGLVVTAACADCHDAHKTLPHTNPLASTSPRNIARTCMSCHARIEQVHAKIIRGELWEKTPGAIPACTDCHVPHKVRKEILSITLSNRDCLKCHADPALERVSESGEHVSMFVDANRIDASVHTNMPCVKCHTDVDPRRKRPCEPSGAVDCSNCHAKIAAEYDGGGHGVALARGEKRAPGCTTCHGGHDVWDHAKEDAPTYRASVPALCGECHREGGDATLAADLSQKTVLADYSTSVHGRGLVEKGLLPSAVCIDCHGAHGVMKHTDPRSSVNPKNIPATCATCHRGIYKEFVTSVHFNPDETKRELPNCASCHSSHAIGQVGQDAFMTEVTGQCGSCHEDLAETYLETMHGKAYKLGYLEAAKCSDCHGAHAIQSINSPASSVGPRKVVETCRKCHADANVRFTGYLTHATHHDPKKYPALFYTYWAMTILLVGVFGFFGVHTILWLPRSFRAMLSRRTRAHAEGAERYWIVRFNRTQRFTHILVIVSFLSLATTGMMIRFSGLPWTEFLAGALGGVKGAGIIHRFAATITFGYFALHLTSLARMKKRRRLSLRQLVLGPGSMMFNRKDLTDFVGTMKWFFGQGPRPAYGRWAYWEKFDYLAVFWGVAIIGSSGLMLWFPEFFTRLLPGWLINVATIVHSDEALLAVGFIFTVHFFNTHLRPEAFPMDLVVFTGKVPLADYKADRPAEYAELVRSGEIRKRVTTKAPSKRQVLLARTFGSLFLAVGVALIVLIISSLLIGYR
jgi:cytochrome b subunit of formate dehydrogenase